MFHEPARRAGFQVLRLPLTVANAVVATLIVLPRLPALTRENGELKAALLQRQMELADAREQLRQAAQAQALREHLALSEGIVASVIGRSPLPTQHTLLLDKGARDGLTLDSVIVDASGLIGRVTEVHPTTCLVMALTDQESRVAGLLERSRETGLLVGRDRGRCEFIYLDLDADVQEGDRVLTAGLGGPFPKGLLLGTVRQVLKDAQAGSAVAVVEPAARLSHLEEVFCLPSAAGPPLQ